jgi:hypothetical protein
LVIKKYQIIPDATNIRDYGWSGLRRYQNISFTTSEIIKHQQVPANQHPNVNKQSSQIRDCLIQAEEYFNSAKHVSLATKPLLLYYGIMSLALADILIKQDGNSSLDRARRHHAHHGLQFINRGNPNKSNLFSESGTILACKPAVREKGNRYGTFELWHSSSRELPICGRDNLIFSNLTSRSSVSMQLDVHDVRPPLIVDDGIDLLTIFKAIPSLAIYLGSLNIASSKVRGKFTRTFNENNVSWTNSLIIHPASNDVLDRVYEKILFSANAVNILDVRQMNSGLVINWIVSPNSDTFTAILPTNGQQNLETIFLESGDSSLNEFGLCYAGLFILGNYARYFPEQWMRDVEEFSELAFLAYEFLSTVELRVPLLCLNEMSQSLHIGD